MSTSTQDGVGKKEGELGKKPSVNPTPQKHNLPMAMKATQREKNNFEK